MLVILYEYMFDFKYWKHWFHHRISNRNLCPFPISGLLSLFRFILSYLPFEQLNENSYNFTGSFNGLHPGMYYITVKDSVGCLFTINNIVVTQPRSMLLFHTSLMKYSHILIVTIELVATPRFSSPVCYNTSTGSLSLSVTGGTTPYHNNRDHYYNV